MRDNPPSMDLADPGAAAFSIASIEFDCRDGIAQRECESLGRNRSRRLFDRQLARGSSPKPDQHPCERSAASDTSDQVTRTRG